MKLKFTLHENQDSMPRIGITADLDVAFDKTTQSWIVSGGSDEFLWEGQAENRTKAFIKWLENRLLQDPITIRHPELDSGAPLG